MNENSVYVVIINSNLVVLKEYWPNWDLIFDPVKVSSYKKKNKEDNHLYNFKKEIKLKKSQTKKTIQ